MDERLRACFWLRKYFYPNAPVAGGLEVISYPYPDNQGGISILLRELDDPTTLQVARIPASAWMHRKVVVQ